jgi:hypothetical protein
MIGLWGPAGVGKDTIFKHLEPHGWVRVSYGDTLRRTMVDVLKVIGLDLDPFDDAVKREYRDLYVAVAESAKKLDPYHWVNRSTIWAPAGGLACVTDVRDVPDVVGVLRHGGLVIQLERPLVGPANETERRTFAAIETFARDNGVRIPCVLNTPGDPEHAALKVMELADQFFAQKKAA